MHYAANPLQDIIWYSYTAQRSATRLDNKNARCQIPEHDKPNVRWHWMTHRAKGNTGVCEMNARSESMRYDSQTPSPPKDLATLNFGGAGTKMTLWSYLFGRAFILQTPVSVVVAALAPRTRSPSARPRTAADPEARLATAGRRARYGVSRGTGVR